MCLSAGVFFLSFSSINRFLLRVVHMPSYPVQVILLFFCDQNFVFLLNSPPQELFFGCKGQAIHFLCPFFVISITLIHYEGDAFVVHYMVSFFDVVFQRYVYHCIARLAFTYNRAARVSMN